MGSYREMSIIAIAILEKHFYMESKNILPFEGTNIFLPIVEPESQRTYNFKGLTQSEL